MAGIFDTLAQVRMEQPAPNAEWAKQVEAANAKAAAIKAARGAATAPVAPATGPLFGAGRFLGKLASRFGPAAGLGAMGFGMADQAAAIQSDPEPKPLAERALQVLSGADVTGFGAWMGRKLTGRPDPLTASPPAAPAPTGYQVDASQYTDAPVLSAPASTPAPGPGALPAVTPMTAADIRGTVVPPSGTGAFVNSSGAVTNLDTRSVAGPGAVAGGFVNRAAPGSLASFFGAAMNQKQIAATEARDMAKAKLMQEFALKLPGAMKDTAEAGNVNLRSQAAQEHLIANPGDYAGAAGIASGRIQPGDKHVFLPTMDGNKVDVGNKATGAIQRKTPLPQINEADILQTMKNNKMTREQVLARLKAEGKM